MRSVLAPFRRSGLLPVCVWSALAWFSTHQIAPLGACPMLAGLASLAAFWVLDRHPLRQVRTGIVWLLAPLLFVVGWYLGGLPLQWSFPSQVLGADWTFALVQLFRTVWFWGILVYLVRWTSRRHAPFIVLECALISSQVMWYFVGHQQGFINRPFAFVDPLWAKGVDPAPAFLLVGLLVAITVSVLLAVGRGQQLDQAVSVAAPDRERFERPSARVWRWANLAALVAILMAIFVWVPSQKIQEYSEKYGPAGGDEDEVRYGKDGKASKSDKEKGPKPRSSGKNPGASPSPSKGQPTPGQASPSPGQNPDGGSPTPDPNQTPGSGNANDPSSGPSQSQNQPQFSDTPQAPKNSPIAVVIFQDDYKPESEVYYLRQSAYSEFNGLKLIKSSDSRFDRDIASNFPTARRTENPSGESGGAILPAFNPKAFKKVNTRVALMTQHARPFGLANASLYWACDNPDPSRFQKAFEVESFALTLPYKKMLGLRSVDSVWSPAEVEYYTQPPPDPRFREMADKILKESSFSAEMKKNDFVKAVAVKLWLDENCTYSLKSEHKDAADPVASFLFGDRVGYCVFTSHSAAYLYRSLGIPARIAEGYAVPAANRGAGSTLLVRTRDAHSWPEIYLEGLGWLPLDITPKKTLVPPADEVDPGLQQMLGDMARQENQEDPKDPLEKPRIDLRQLLKALLIQLWWGLPWAILGTALFLLVMKTYRRWVTPLSFRYYRQRPLSGEGSRQLTLRAYRGVLDQLADRGLCRQHGQSREDFARQHAAELPTLMSLTRSHLSGQLGRRDVPVVEVEGQWQEVQKEVGRLPKGWRYYLRLINPVSWWSVQ